MSYWLLKTEPSSYSFEHRVTEGRAVWDGVRNNLALKHLREMKAGDRLLIYHTGDEKRIVGLARVTKAAYPDPKGNDPKLAVVDLAPEGRLPRPVSLAAIRGEAAFADFALVRMPRLSVMPVTSEQWKRVIAMGGE